MKKEQCSLCGKLLTDPVSIAFGLGPVCRVKKKTQDMNTENLFASRAEYDYVIDDNILAIEDKNGMKSVTSDIKNILSEIAEDHDLSTMKIMYKDTEGIWDGVSAIISNVNGKIEVRNLQFFPLTETDYRQAKQKILNT